MTLIEVLKAESGKPLVLDDVRMLMDMNREAFDSVLSELMQSKTCVLSMDDGCVMIRYIIPSVDAATAMPIQREPVVKACAKSATRGRPRVEEHLKRVVINHIRLPLWLSEHLKDRGNAGKVVEKALLEYYCLSPPC